MNSNNRLLFIPATILISFLLVSCQAGGGEQSNDTAEPPTSENQLTEEAEQQDKPQSKDGLTLEAEQMEYETSNEELSATLHNNSDEDITTGTYLFLEKKVDGTWYEFPYEQEAFEEVGQIISADSTSGFSVSTNELKYELTPGEYRFTKEGLAAPFTVTK